MAQPKKFIKVKKICMYKLDADTELEKTANSHLKMILFFVFAVFDDFFWMKWNKRRILTGNQIKRDLSNGSQEWSYVMQHYRLRIYQNCFQFFVFNIIFHCHINTKLFFFFLLKETKIKDKNWKEWAKERIEWEETTQV